VCPEAEARFADIVGKISRVARRSVLPTLITTINMLEVMGERVAAERLRIRLQAYATEDHSFTDLPNEEDYEACLDHYDVLVRQYGKEVIQRMREDIHATQLHTVAKS
jgi:hypothetical protein